MKGINKVILVGHLGKDPDVQYLEGNICLAKFPLATSDSYKDKSGNKIDQTEWHNIVLWRGLAEIAEKYVRKGSFVYLEGKIETRSYEKDGVTKYYTQIVGRNLMMLDKKGESPIESEPKDIAEQADNISPAPEHSESEIKDGGQTEAAAMDSQTSETSASPSTEGEKVADDLPF